MASVTLDLIGALSDEEIRALAERLRPYLPEPQSADEWLRGAKEIGAYLSCSPKRVHNLVATGQLAVERDGQAYVVKRSTLDDFVKNGGGKSP